MARRRKPKSPEQIALEAAQKRAAERDASKNPTMYGISEETIGLQRARGELITSSEVRPGERDKPLGKRDGLGWLNEKGRITQAQWIAGLRYGDIYRSANDVRLRSGVNFDVQGGDPTGSQQLRMEAADKLNAARARLCFRTSLISVVDQVAGEGRRLRELADNDFDAAKMEGALCAALDLLAKFYGVAA